MGSPPSSLGKNRDSQRESGPGGGRDRESAGARGDGGRSESVRTRALGADHGPTPALFSALTSKE